MACTSVVFPVPSSPESPITAGAVRSRPSASPNRWSSSADRRMTDGVGLGTQLEDLVAQQGGELEVELFGGGLHLALEQGDERVALLRVRGARHATLGGTRGLGVRHPGREPHLIDRFLDRSGRNTVLRALRP